MTLIRRNEISRRDPDNRGRQKIRKEPVQKAPVLTRRKENAPN